MEGRPSSPVLNKQLFRAVRRNIDPDEIRMLLRRVANVQAASPDNFDEPIHLATTSGHFLNDETGKDICTLLARALKQDRLDVEQLLLDQGVNVHAPLIEGDTLFCWAARHGHSKTIQLLLDTGLSVHDANDAGSKPIHVAVSHGHVKIVEIFLSNGSSVEETDWWGRTPLHFAAEKSQFLVAKFLLNKGANVHARQFAHPHQKAIHVAADCGYKKMVELFLNYGNNVDEIDKRDFTPLHYAMRCGCLDLVRLLISRRAEVHAKTIDGQKPIHQAAFYGHREIVELFLNIGVNVNNIDRNGQSPLHLATMQGHFSVVQLLIKCANSTDVDSSASVLSSQERTIVVKDALSQGSVIDAQDKEGRTPLHLACQSYKVEIIQCLLEAGARSDIKDKCHNTATFYLLKACKNPFNRSLLLVPEFLQKMHFFNINAAKSSVAHIVMKRRVSNIEQVKLVLQYQKDLNVKDVTRRAPLNYLTDPNPITSIDKRSELIRFVINHGAYFSALDCQNIIANPVLKKDLFTDVKLCTQSVVNKFDNEDLPKVYKLISSKSELPPLDKMKVKSTQVRAIELALEQQIKDNGYCDVSSRMLVSLSMLCVEVYISHYGRMQYIASL